MDLATQEYIKTNIIPLIQQGKVALFLGSGFSVNTPVLNHGTVPSSSELVTLICNAVSLPPNEAKDMDLKDAFDFGSEDIENFDQFLANHFTNTKPSNWQTQLFQHWWRIVFTTNIDDIPVKSIESLKRTSRDKTPDYKIYHYRDRESVHRYPAEPPLVFLHGMAWRAKEGLIFDEASYSDTTVRPGDWFPEAASQITAGNCLFIGSRFKEPDIQAAIKNKQLWTNPGSSRENWIVLKSFRPSDLRIYKKRGLTPIEASAEDFVSFINSQIKPMTCSRFIKTLLPHINFGENQSLAASWFASSFDHIPTKISENKNKRGLFSRFYFGDMPDWFYVANNIPANFKIIRHIEEKIIELEQSNNTESILIVKGPVCSGKTTACMMALKNLSASRQSIYHYSSVNGVDIDLLWKTIKDTKGTLILFFDNSSEWFYAINDVVKRCSEIQSSRRLIIILECCTKDYNANARHLSDLRDGTLHTIDAAVLNIEDALHLVGKLSHLGIKFEQLADLDQNASARKIVNFDTGFRGDLLATLCNLATVEPYKNKLDAEVKSISDPLARKIFLFLSLVTSVKHSLPLNYISEICGFSSARILECISSELSENVRHSGDGTYISIRHSLIAKYHLDNTFEKPLIKDAIIQMMQTLHKKFTVPEIKYHPLPYRIYKDLLSCHYLVDEIFTKTSEYDNVEEIYTKCQTFFSEDGIFWLQFGRLYDKLGKLEEAIHCFRMGLSLYSSFQTRHALGHVLLKKYIATKLLDESLFDEGYDLLKYELEIRGKNDPYPVSTLLSMLIEILAIKFTDALHDTIRKTINQNQRHYKDAFFSQQVTKFLQVSKKYGKTAHQHPTDWTL